MQKAPLAELVPQCSIAPSSSRAGLLLFGVGVGVGVGVGGVGGTGVGGTGVGLGCGLGEGGGGFGPIGFAGRDLATARLHSLPLEDMLL